MIVAMQKITILGFHRAQEDFLSRLQELGVMHITLAERPQPAAVQSLADEIRRGERFLHAAEKASSPGIGVPGAGEISRAPSDITVDYERIQEERERLLQQLDKCERVRRNIAPWGRFDFSRVRQLAESGIHVRFFIAPLNKIDAVIARVPWWTEISRDKTYAYFVVFERGQGVSLDCEEFDYPDRGTEQLDAEAAKITARLGELDESVRGLFACRERIRVYVNQQKTEYAFRRLSSGLRRMVDDKVFFVFGWVPRTHRAAVERFLRNERVYYETALPQPGDDVPVLLQNNRFSRLFEPITRLFDLPHYHELDVTAFFAPFFTLFFGFCLSDAGYGLVILAACLLFFRRVPAAHRNLLYLGMTFGISTGIVGLISGTLFGVDTGALTVPGVTWLKHLILFTQDELFYVALMLGVIQVFFGMALKVINRCRQFGFMAGAGTVGWMIFLAGILRLLLPSIVTVPAASWAGPAAWAGFIIILLFNDVKANIFVRIGKGLWEVYGITGIFGDILSYVRLFALGVSSTILGMVINEIGWSLRTVPYVGFGLTFMVLVGGHTGNLLLGALSSFVHPLRLTFVEFYKSVGFAGGGRAYQPFSRVRDNAPHL